MKFDQPLIEGTLIKRYKRFLADVQLPNEAAPLVVVHVANPGSMLGVSDPGSRCRVSRSSNLTRKLAYSLEMVETKAGQWVGVNTSLTNKLVHEAFTQKVIPDWNQFTEIKGEVKISKESRLDFLLSGATVQRYVEVKNVSMANAPWAMFPDAVTERGQKHLRDLMNIVRLGVHPTGAMAGHAGNLMSTQKVIQCEILFVVQREDCDQFRPCDEIDPVYGKLLREAAKAGVIVTCWACEMSRERIALARQLKVNF